VTKIPQTWQRELRAQRIVRRHLHQAEAKHQRLLKLRDKIMKRGGKGWVTAIGNCELAIERAFNDVRRYMKRLYLRKAVA
jgi:hypothetical protein